MVPNPFEEAAQPTQSPLEGITQDTQVAGAGLSDKSIDVTSRMAAMAVAPPSPTGEMYQALTAMYNDNIRRVGDDQVRTEVATKQQADEFRELNKLINNSDLNFDPDGTIAAGARMAADQTIYNSIQNRKEYALEQEALKRIQDMAAMGDYTQAKILMNTIEHGSADSIINDLNTKRMIMQREVEKAGVAVEEQSWFMHAVDFIASAVGDLTLNNSLDRNNLVDIDNGMKNWYDWMFSGQRARNEAGTLWSLPPEEFARQLRDTVIPRVKDHSSFVGYTSKTQMLSLLQGLQNTPAPMDANMGDFVAVGGLASLIPVGKIASIPMALVRNGARKEAAQLIADTSLLSVREGAEAAAKKTGVSTDEVIANTVPTAMNVTGPEHLVPLTGDAMAGIARGKALLSKLDEWTQGGRLTDDELQVAIAKEQERLFLEIGRPLKDFKAEPLKHSDGSETTRFEFLLGKKKGGGFATKESAASEARRLGIASKEFVRSEDGQWFIKETRDLNESGYITTNLNPGLNRTGILGRIFLGSRQIDDDIIAGQARQATNTRNKLITTLYKTYHKDLTELNPVEKGYLSNTLAWGENQGVWLSRNEIDVLFEKQGAGPISDKGWTAYNATREINDIEFELRNTEIWKSKAIKGFETASFNHPLFRGGRIDRENALIGRSKEHKPNGRIFDLHRNKHYKSNELTPERFRDMMDDGYVVVSLEKEQTLLDGSTVKHFMMKKPNLEAERLRVDQLPYRAGGHRLYTDKYFVKQTRYGKQPDGEKFLQSPAAYISGTRAEVELWAKTMERARQYVKYELKGAGGDLTRLEEILGPVTGLKADDVVKMFDDGRLQLDTEFKPMFDRELPAEYLEATSPLDFVDLEETGFTGWLRTNGRMYYSSKGEALHDWQWERARTIDPFQATQEALNNIANITSFSDYKMSAVTRWVQTYGPNGMKVLDTGGLPNNASDLTIFSEAKLRSNVDKMPMGAGPRVKQQMEAQRDIIRRNLGWRSDLDRAMDRQVEEARAFIMGADPNSPWHKFQKESDLPVLSVNWWEDKNPLSAMRGLAFDLKMGLFNIAQFPLQIQTIVSTMALGGAKAVDGLVEIPAMRWYLSKAGNDAGLPALAKSFGYRGAEIQDWTLMMQAAKRSGFFDVGTSHQLINTQGPSATVGGFSSGWDALTKKGRVFFNEGEVWNRMVAWQTAWREQLAVNPRGVHSKDFMRNVALRADDYSMNMMAPSAANWQHGIASIPTQFWAYQARMLEAMTFGKQFTPAQKMRLFVAQTFFYGAASAPLLSIPSALIKSNTGEAPDLNTAYGFYDRGVIDHVIWNMFGADVAAGKRYGTGAWLPDMVGEMFGASPYGEKSFVEMTGGATFNIMAQSGDTLLDLITHVTAESGTQDFPLLKQDVMRMAKNISTFSYGHKAYIALKYNEYSSNTGTVVSTDMPSANAFFYALGISPGDQDDIAAASSWRKNRKEAIKEASTYISNQRARMEVETDRRGEIAAEINAYMRLVPPDIRVEALKEANRRTPSTLKEGLAKQLEKEKTQREILRDGVTN